MFFITNMYIKLISMMCVGAFYQQQQVHFNRTNSFPVHSHFISISSGSSRTEAACTKRAAAEMRLWYKSIYIWIWTQKVAAALSTI